MEFRVTLLITASFFTLVACQMNMSFDYGSGLAGGGSTSPSGEKVTQVSITGANDAVADHVLKSSPYATLNWSGGSADKYAVTVYAPDGVTVKCPQVVVSGSSTTLSSCNLDDHVTYKLGIAPVDVSLNPITSAQALFDLVTQKLRWVSRSLDLFPGESVQLQVLDGVAPVTASDTSSYLDDDTLLYTVPAGAAPGLDTLTVQDGAGTTDQISVAVRGFIEDAPIPGFPLAHDWVGTRGTVVTSSGAIIVVTDSEDAQWYSNWVTYRSTDRGQTWTAVDALIPPINGSDYGYTYAHGVATDNVGNVYTCGYRYDDNVNDQWVVRRSLDDGLTWATSDHIGDISTAADCFDVTVDSAGNVYAVGSIGSDGFVVRMSSDHGASWNTIYTAASPGGARIAFGPDGQLWVAAIDGGNLNIIKGSYSGGVWSFSAASSIPTLSYQYDEWGSGYGNANFVFVSSTNAYFSGRLGNQMRVLQTTDGGATWTEDYASGASSYGQGIVKAQDGSLLAYGTIYQTRNYPLVMKKDFGGSTWNSVFDLTDYKLNYWNGYLEGGVVMPDGEIILMNDEEVMNGLTGAQAVKSTDMGLNWTMGPDFGFWQIYNTYSDSSKRVASGAIEAVFEFWDSNANWGTVLKRTKDNGQTWTTLREQTDGSRDILAYDDDGSGHIYIYERGNPSGFIVVSSNDGVSWTDIPITSYLSASGSVNEFTVFPGSKHVVAFVNDSGVTSILKSTNFGTSWNAGTVFPITPGASSFVYGSSFAETNGTLWLAGQETSSAAIYDEVVYSSTDEGVTWSEKLRFTMNSGDSTAVKRGDDGLLYAFSGVKIKKSSDNGATWSDLAGPALASYDDLQVSASGKIFVFNENSGQLATISNLMNDWVIIDDLSLDNRYDLTWDAKIYFLGSDYLGLLTRYTTESPGDINFFRKVKFQ